MDNYGTGSLDVIGRLDNNNRWSRAGNLAETRYGHGAVFIDGFFLVIGGGNTYPKYKQTEKCSLQQGAVSCTSQEPSFSDYSFYPELFMVADSFCQI